MHVLGIETHAYGVFAFIAPAIGWAHVAITFDGLSTASPQSLVFRPYAFASASCSHPLDFCTFVVMRYKTAPVAVLNFKVTLVASCTVQTGRWHEVGEEVGETCEGFRTWRIGRQGDMRKRQGRKRL
jgi:hypothetical protein